MFEPLAPQTFASSFKHLSLPSIHAFMLFYRLSVLCKRHKITNCKGHIIVLHSDPISTAVSCERNAQILELEGRLVAITAVAAVFGVVSAILLALLIFLHRGTIAFKLRQLFRIKQSPSDLPNRNHVSLFTFNNDRMLQQK